MSLSTRTIVTLNDADVAAEAAALEKTRKAQSAFRVFEDWAAAAIFFRFAMRGMNSIMQGPARFVFYPAVLAFSAVSFLLSVRKAHLEKKIQGQVSRLTAADVAVN